MSRSHRWLLFAVSPPLIFCTLWVVAADVQMLWRGPRPYGPAGAADRPELEVAIHSDDLITGICFHPKSDIVASSGWKSKQIAIWRASTGELLDTIQCRSTVQSLFFLPPGDTLVGTDGLGNLLQLSVSESSRRVAVPLPGWRPDPQGGELTATPDGNFLAIHAMRDILVWDVRQRRPLRLLPGHDILTRGALFDREHLITIGVDRVVRKWNFPTGELVEEHEDYPVAPSCATGLPGLRAVALGNPLDGSIWVAPFDDLLAGRAIHIGSRINALVPVRDSAVVLVGCGADSDQPGLVYCCDVLTGRHRLLLSSPSPVRHMAVSSGGKWLVTADVRGTVRVWDTDQFNLSGFLSSAKK